MAPPAVGGVCAHLDYEVDQMADYVSEMAQRLMNPASQVSPAFRKFCSGLLSSTRLPSTTILLGLNYLSRRVNAHKAAGPYNPTDGQIWRMLTIGLLLGSKFLDDNTFQNRSWSEVSGIAVFELNMLEHEWLESMDWSLYVNLDKSRDFKAWLENWETWKKTKDFERSSSLDRVTPLARIDTDVARYAQVYGTRGSAHANPKTRDPNRYDQYYEQPKASWHTYPTPPSTTQSSALNSPMEQMSATGGAPRYNDWAVYTQYPRGYTSQIHATYAPTRVAAYHTPFSNHYAHQYGGNTWEGNASCNCTHCDQHVKQSYFMGHGYGQQIVA